MCVDLKDGKIWLKGFVAKTADVPAELQARAAASAGAATSCGFAAPTPVSNGVDVSSLFLGLRLDLEAIPRFDGNRKWIQYLESVAGTFGHSSSPLLIDGKLLVNVKHLVALDAATGKMVWECPEAEHTYGTPVGMDVGGTKVVVTPLGKVVYGKLDLDVWFRKRDRARIGRHRRAESARWLTVTWFIWEIVRSLPCNCPFWAITRNWQKLTANLDVSSYASPVVWKGMLFFVGTTGDVCLVLDVALGEDVLHEEELKIGHPGVEDPILSTANLYPSLVVAGGKLFVGNDQGQTFVYEASKDIKEISQNRMAEGSGSTLAVIDSALIIRSGNTLCRIGK